MGYGANGLSSGDADTLTSQNGADRLHGGARPMSALSTQVPAVTQPQSAQVVLDHPWPRCRGFHTRPSAQAPKRPSAHAFAAARDDVGGIEIALRAAFRWRVANAGLWVACCSAAPVSSSLATKGKPAAGRPGSRPETAPAARPPGALPGLPPTILGGPHPAASSSTAPILSARASPGRTLGIAVSTTCIAAIRSL